MIDDTLMKKLIIIGVVSLLLVGGGVYLLGNQNKKTPMIESAQSSAYEYFWGDGCPHCKNVEAFLTSWDKKDKIQIDKKEVWNNQFNQALMLKRAQSCGLNQNELGVPLLHTPDGKCITGDQPIIDYLRNLNP